MKNTTLLILGLSFSFLAGCASTGRVVSIQDVEDVSVKTVKQEMAQKTEFYTNKRFTYLMAWNGVPVGQIVAESGQMIKYRGRDCYRVSVTTESNKFLSKIYRVEDVYISYIDSSNMSSMRFEADRREGTYRKHLIVEYDFKKLEAINMNLTDGSVKRSPIMKDVQDPVSAICRFMTLSLDPDETIKMIVNLNEKNYELYGDITELDVISLPELGEIPAFKLLPYARLEDKDVKKGRGWMYFGSGKRRYPLYGRVWIPFGRVTATLRKIEDI